MFQRVRNLGGWFFASVVLPEEFEKFDAMRPNAIDGLDGGTYAPSALLSIGGLAITLNPTTLTLSGTSILITGSVDAPLVSTDSITADAITISNATHTVNLASRAATRSEDSTPRLSGTDWAFTSTGTILASIANGDHVEWPITAPHGSVLTAFAVLLQPSGGHGGLPANLPALLVYKRNLTTGGTTNVATATDSSASVAAYQAVHTVTASGFTETIDRATYGYFARISNEFGVDALVGLTILGAKRTTTVTKIDEAS